MEMIDESTVRVDSFTDLSSILTSNNQFTYVYLGIDINMTSGIQLHNDRSLLIIDGEYPQGSGIIHTLRDAGDDSGMIYKNNISNLDITFQNMTITGRNYLGMPRIANENRNVTITYRNVTYTGPQMTWHWSGLTRYIDCDITIMFAGYSAVHEMAEICQVEIGGKTTIRHNNSNAYAVFYFYKTNASLTILADAEVEISTNYDFLYHEHPPQFIIQPRASLTLTTQRGISRNASFRLSSFLVDEYASFRYIQRSNSEGDAALYINGAFTVNKGARVYMQADFASSSASKRLVQFTTVSSSRGLYLNNPKSFVLYNLGIGTAIYFSGVTPFVFSSEQVNFWRNAGLFPNAGTFDDPPLYPWHNPDWRNFEIRGSATRNSTTVESSTLVSPVSPVLENLKLHEARVLSVGELPLTVHTIVDDQTPVTGQTDSYANIRVEYTDEGGTHRLIGTANETGYFSVPTPAPILLDTLVTVSANVPFLYKTVPKTAQKAGELYIESAPKRIRFVVPCISTSPLIILGHTPCDPIWVVDKRVYSTEWELMVTIDGPMRCMDPPLQLPGDVIFMPNSTAYDAMEPLVPNVPKRVYMGERNRERTLVTWDSNMELLLHLTGAIQIGKDYIANIEWTVNPIKP